MGNVKKDTILQVWNNDKFQALRNNLLDGVRTGICEDCDFYGVKPSGIKERSGSFGQMAYHLTR